MQIDRCDYRGNSAGTVCLTALLHISRSDLVATYCEWASITSVKAHTSSVSTRPEHLWNSDKTATNSYRPRVIHETATAFGECVPSETRTMRQSYAHTRHDWKHTHPHNIDISEAGETWRQDYNVDPPLSKYLPFRSSTPAFTFYILSIFSALSARHRCILSLKLSIDMQLALSTVGTRVHTTPTRWNMRIGRTTSQRTKYIGYKWTSAAAAAAHTEWEKQNKKQKRYANLLLCSLRAASVPTIESPISMPCGTSISSERLNADSQP